MFLWLRGYAPLVPELLCGGAEPPVVVFLSEAALIAAIPPYSTTFLVLGGSRCWVAPGKGLCTPGGPRAAPCAWQGIGHSFGMGSVSAWERGSWGSHYGIPRSLCEPCLLP